MGVKLQSFHRRLRVGQQFLPLELYCLDRLIDSLALVLNSYDIRSVIKQSSPEIIVHYGRFLNEGPQLFKVIFVVHSCDII